MRFISFVLGTLFWIAAFIGHAMSENPFIAIVIAIALIVLLSC